jgi:polysaccharide deacetylase family protein (PEP-CTERM system associated)
MADPTLILSIDVEEWFQTENFHGILSRDDWGRQESRIAASVHAILDLLDDRQQGATFFILGCVADAHRDLVAEIARRGYEVASHGYGHELIYRQTPEAFRDDVTRAKALLEDITGVAILGYRAPAYSITEWSADILLETGHVYDSSLFPVSAHDRYGSIDIGGDPAPILTLPCGLVEVTLPTLELGRARLPWAGGGYFRLLPYPLFRAGIDRILQRRNSFVFYFHPPEIDPGQPVMPGLGPMLHFRQYVGLKENFGKVRRLLTDYRFAGMAATLREQGLLPLPV